MRIILVPDFQPLTLPLPLWSSIHVADAILADNNEEFSIFVGCNKKMVAELKALSSDTKDTELQKNTSDMQRFGLSSYEDWYKKERVPFALIHRRTNSLAALVWLGPKSFGQAGNWHTLGWRSYNPWRGRGLMKDFTNFAMNFYKNRFPDATFWISTKEDNTGSMFLAKALGFKVLEKAPDDISSLIMVK